MAINVFSMITYTYKVTQTKFTKEEGKSENIIDYCEGEIEGDEIMAVKGKLRVVNLELLDALAKKYKIDEDDINEIFLSLPKVGKVGIALSHKIPGTMGDYSSTGVEISAEFSDIIVGGNGIHKAVSVLKEKLGEELPELFNNTLEGMGLKPYFKKEGE